MRVGAPLWHSQPAPECCFSAGSKRDEARWSDLDILIFLTLWFAVVGVRGVMAMDKHVHFSNVHFFVYFENVFSC